MNPFKSDQSFLPNLPDPTETADPFSVEESYREQWIRTAVKWRVAHLAREAFGEGTSVRSSTLLARGAFSGGFDVEVPFESIEEHHRKEEIFSSWIGADPFLAGRPFLYVLGVRLR